MSRYFDVAYYMKARVVRELGTPKESGIEFDLFAEGVLPFVPTVGMKINNMEIEDIRWSTVIKKFQIRMPPITCVVSFILDCITSDGEVETDFYFRIADSIDESIDRLRKIRDGNFGNLGSFADSLLQKFSEQAMEDATANKKYS